MKTTTEFNKKYEAFLEKGHYGLDIQIPSVIEYLDTVFEELTKIEGFSYSQIKLKFRSARVYTNLYTILPSFARMMDNVIENEIDILIRIDDAVYIETHRV